MFIEVVILMRMEYAIVQETVYSTKSTPYKDTR